MNLKLIGALLRSPDPAALRTFLAQFARQTDAVENSYHLRCPGCDLWIEKGTYTPVPEAPEEYYTGLAHLAFRRQDLVGATKRLQMANIPIVQGNHIPFNPKVWGTGMCYVNPVCDFGFGLELCQRLDLPDTDKFTGIDHIGIPVADMAESLAFYKALGFAVASDVNILRAADGAIIHNVMAAGYGTVLELYEFALPSHKPIQNGAFAALRFRAESAQEVAMLQAKGAKFMGPGLWSLTAPGGERLEFFA